jgi:hypothetical protein
MGIVVNECSRTQVSAVRRYLPIMPMWASQGKRAVISRSGGAASRVAKTARKPVVKTSAILHHASGLFWQGETPLYCSSGDHQCKPLQLATRPPFPNLDPLRNSRGVSIDVRLRETQLTYSYMTDDGLSCLCEACCQVTIYFAFVG